MVTALWQMPALAEGWPLPVVERGATRRVEVPRAVRLGVVATVEGQPVEESFKLMPEAQTRGRLTQDLPMRDSHRVKCRAG